MKLQRNDLNNTRICRSRCGHTGQPEKSHRLNGVVIQIRSQNTYSYMGIRPAKMECWLRVSVLNLKNVPSKGIRPEFSEKALLRLENPADFLVLTKNRQRVAGFKNGLCSGLFRLDPVSFNEHDQDIVLRFQTALRQCFFLQ